MALKREDRLKGVDDRLARVVRLAADKLPFDLLVVEGLRTPLKQTEYLSSGASRTLNSKHLVGRAVDLAPMLNGKLRWDWPLFFPIFHAMKAAAKEVGVVLRWGGVWDKVVSQYDDPEREVGLYVARMKKRAAGGSRNEPLIDGPHYELV